MPVQMIELESVILSQASDDALEASAGVAFTVGTYGTGVCGHTNNGFGCLLGK
jgi:hypothetical protein